MWESSTPKVSCTLTPYGEPFHTLFMQIPHPNPFDKQRNQSKRWKQKKNVDSCDRHLCGNAAIGGKICLAGPRTRTGARVFPQGQLRRRWSMAHVIRTNAGGKVTCSRTVWHLFVIFVFFFHFVCDASSDAELFGQLLGQSDGFYSFRNGRTWRKQGIWTGPDL